MKYTIHNPTPARRIIYDGIEGRQRRIDLAPSETKHGVELADHIAAAYGSGADGRRDDLWITAEGQHTPPHPPPLEPVAPKPVLPNIIDEPMPPPAEPPAPTLGPPPEIEGYQRYQAPPVSAEGALTPAAELTTRDLIEAVIADEAAGEEPAQEPEPEPEKKPKKKRPAKKKKKHEEYDAAQ